MGITDIILLCCGAWLFLAGIVMFIFHTLIKRGKQIEGVDPYEF